MTETEDQLTTTSFEVSAFLLAKGFEPSRGEQKPNQKSVPFIFKGKGVRKASHNYFKGEPLPAIRLFESYRSIKDLAFQS